MRAAALPILVALASCGGGGDAAVEPAAQDSAPAERITCPPCGMQTTPPVEVTVVGDYRFWLCNERCAELVRRDPARFAEHALED